VPRPIANPPNPWLSTHVEFLGEAPPAKLEVFEETAKSILSENDSPDLNFRFSLNPYRGCYHGCAYCYARPSHQYWGFGAGTDFERKIVVKVNAPEVLRETFMKPSWKGETITISGNTDCYQPLEAAYELTRRCLEVCLEFRQPVGLITKGALVRRDAELLGKLVREAHAAVYLSIPFADDETARKVEPYASSTTKRFETMKILSDAGVPTGISISPVIPGLNDEDIPELLGRARDAGATGSFMVMLRLPSEVLPVFDERMTAEFPDRIGKIKNAVREARGGDRMNDSRFGKRMEGQGIRWRVIEQLFEQHRRKLGLDQLSYPEETTFRRPTKQLALF
jgi:DNA repair photolyase